MVQIDCNRSSAIYSCVIAFFFSSLPFDRRSRILEEKIVSTAFVHQYFLIFLVARSGFCAISPVLDDRIGIIAVSVCRSIAGGWLKIRGRGLSPWKFYSSRGEWKSQRFRDETMNEREREWTFREGEIMQNKGGSI